jgi:hypothetical protein
MSFIESGYVSLNKYGEELCGDCVEIINQNETVTMVLADGLGSGVKANILATLTSKIIGTMLANGLEIEDAVQTIAHTLPVCSQRKIAYSTFSILQVDKSGEAYLVQFDNPVAIFIRNSKCTDYPMKKIEVDNKKIYESHFSLQKGDMFLLISDGVVHAGLGKVYNLGWQQEHVCKYVEDNFSETITAKGMAALLAGACKQLYIDMPGDDVTVAVLRIRDNQTANVMIGPPVDKKDDEDMVKQFLANDGQKVVCGGTTSQIVGRYLGENVKTSIDYIVPNIPPTASIKGIDLVTEGVLTLSRVLKLSKEFTASSDPDTEYFSGKDGASQLARLLIEKSTTIRFFVGRAINPAHQNPEFPAELSIKSKLVQELAQSLRNCGKQVEVKFF